MHSSRLSKTVKRRNRRRIYKLFRVIEELENRTPDGLDCHPHIDWSPSRINDFGIVHGDDRNAFGNSGADDDDDEAARNRLIWNASLTHQSLPSPSRTSTSARACSLPLPPMSETLTLRASLVSSWPVSCTVQLFAVDIAASEKARDALCSARL
jgi:hypothetical protein